MTNTNLPISGLTEQKFNIQKIKDVYFDDEKNFDIDERLMYFAVAYLNGSNYVSRKVSFQNMLQAYTYSQQFICDLTEVLHMNDVIQNYDFYHGNTKLIPDNNRIVIPDNTSALTSLIESHTAELNKTQERVDELINFRCTYDLKFNIIDVKAENIQGALYENETNTIVYTINHDLNLTKINNVKFKTPNIKLYEKIIGENTNIINNNQTSAINPNNYIETYVDVLIHKEITINNNTLIIKLFFENTDTFEGRLLIN